MSVRQGLGTVGSRARSAAIIVVASGVVITLAHYLQHVNIVINPLIWSGTQIIAVLLSFTIAANVLVRFHGTGNRASLFLGLTFVVNGFIQLAGIFEFYQHVLTRAEIHRVPLSWMIGQTFLGVLFLVAYAVNKRLPWPRDPNRNIFAVLAVVVATCCLIAVAFLLSPNEPPIHPQSIVPRAWDLLPAAIFLLAALFLRGIKDADHFAFDRVLVWVAAMNYGSHLMASQSARLLDLSGAAAQLVSTASYVVLLGATLLDNARLFGQVRSLAITDSVTGLSNYRRLIDVLQSELERSGRTSRSFSLLLMDLDGLKRINDRYGHLVGTRALCRVAQILRLHCRSVDTAARYGGDEFALVLPETDEPAAEQVAERIRNRLEVDQEAPQLSLSIGIATFPHCGTSVHHLLDWADRDLYVKKARSKQRTSQRPHL
jgi:diguanylate cyclase (GGDEF)-like protein